MAGHLPHDRDLHFRANLLLGVLLTLAGVVLGVIAYFYLVSRAHMAVDTRHWTLLLVTGIEAGLLALIALLVHGRYWLAQIGTVSLTLGAVAIGVGLTGGAPDSPALPMLLVPPVIAFCLLGARLGFIVAAVIPVVMALQWFAAAQFGLTLPQWQSLQNPIFDRLVTSTVAYLMVITVVLVYERMNAALRAERDRERERLAHLASHDELTGLANRRYFRERLEEACTRCDRSGQRFAVLLIDLDGFKKINDALGHAAGDVMLAEIAARLRALVRRQDLVARLGGDEFAVIVEPYQALDEINHLHERLRTSVAQPLPFGEGQYAVGASIGVALYPSDTADVDHVLSYADAAMYAAKKRRQVHIVG